jgi:hypothetical protein
MIIPLLDSSMILLQTIIEVFVGSMTYLIAQDAHALLVDKKRAHPL